MNKIFVATHNDTSGFFMCYTGNSGCCGNDYYVITNKMRLDEIPESCRDASTFAVLVAGLLNAFFNGIDISDKDPELILQMGSPDPPPSQQIQDTSLPF